MRDSDLAIYKKRLEDRLADILSDQDIRRMESATVELDQARVGRLSRMDAMQQQAMSQAAARLTEIERQRIKLALIRMQEGEFGYCSNCGEEIVEGRLRFDPSVPTCILCAQKAEEK